MKTIKILLFFVLLGQISCEKNDELQIFSQQDSGGAFIRFDAKPSIGVGASNFNEVEYVFTLLDPNNSVKNYEIGVYANLKGVDTDDIISLKNITNFPAEVVITGAEILKALGLNEAEISYGDIFKFQGKSTNQEGITSFMDLIREEKAPLFKVGDGVNISSRLAQGEGYTGAYLYDFQFFCPEVTITELINSIEGTYQITSPDNIFGVTAPRIREVVKGPAANQITIVGGEYANFGSADLILTLQDTFGNVIIGKSGLIISGDKTGGFESEYGVITGTVFSCEQRISLLSSFASFPSLGNHAFVLEKG